MERALDVTADSDDFLLQLNCYKDSKKNLEPRLSERDSTLKAITASVKQLEKAWLAT